MAHDMRRDEAWLAGYMAKMGKPVEAMPGDTAEKDLTAFVRQQAMTAGWFFYHTFDARRSDPGMLDCFLTDGRDILLYELKTNTGKLTVEQARLLNLLQHTGKVECGVWRPHMKAEIVERLTRGRR